MAKPALKMRLYGHKRLAAKIKTAASYDPMTQVEQRAYVALAMMKEDAPVDTGRLQSELQMVVGNNVIIIFSPTSYSIWQELKYNPFFFINVRKVFPEIREEWRRSFSQVFERRPAREVPLDLNRPFRTVFG